MSSKSRLNAGTILSLAALLWTIGAGIAFLVVPTGTTVSVGTSSGASSGDGTGPETTTVTTTTHETLLEKDGARVLIPLLIPVAVALIGALAGGRRRKGVRLGAGITLIVGCLLAALSFGIFYLPAALLLLASAIRTPAPRAERTPIAL